MNEGIINLAGVSLRQGRTWMNFLGWLSIICGVLYCITIVGAVFGWLPLWLGIVLRRAAKRTDEVLATGDDVAIVGYLEEVSRFFRISGIATLVMLILYAAGMVIYLVVLIFMVAGVGMAGTLKDFGQVVSKEMNQNHRAGTTIPEYFPRSYLAVQDDGNYGAVLIQRSSKPAELPIVENGKEYYEAYICLNEKCPGRAKTGNKPYIFAIPPAKPVKTEEGAMPSYPDLVCPLCKEKYSTVKPQEQAAYDPTHIERYQTEEAIQIINDIRDQFMKKNRR